MKKIWIVVMSTGNKWEINPGVFLVKAVDEAEVREIIAKNKDQSYYPVNKIESINTIENEIGDYEIVTILDAQIE